MGKISYALTKGQPPRLRIKWSMGWKNTIVNLDGVELGRINSKKELMQGREFSLGNNNVLKVQLVSKFTAVELQVTLNGVAVPGSMSDPQRRLANAYGMLFFLAGLNIVLGLLAELLKVDLLLNLGVGIYSILFGAILGLMGLLAWKKQSRIALGIAIAVLIIDGLLGLVSGSTAGFVMRVFLMIPIFGGFGAIKELKTQNKPAAI